MEYIFKSNGQYLGFVDDAGNLFNRDGVYLGWNEGQYVWDKNGKFAGSLLVVDGNKFIIKNVFTVPPVPRIPKTTPATPPLPTPKANIPAIQLPVGFIDAF